MRRFGLLAAMALLVGLGMGCTPSSKPSAVPPSKPAPAPIGPQTFSVSVDATSPNLPLAADQFFPSELAVHPGDTIKFDEVWSGEPHTVTLGTLVDQGPTSTALPSFFPKTGGSVDPIPAAAQPCFLDTGTPPAKAACPAAPQPSFSGGQAFYNSGWLTPTATFTVNLSPTIGPGVYTFRCLVHSDMTGKIHVVPPTQAIPTPASVTDAGTAQVNAAAAALTPAAQNAALVTATNVAGITAGDSVTSTMVATFGSEIDVSVGQTVNFNVYGTHIIAINPPDNAVGLLTKGPDGVVHLNTNAIRSAGGESPPVGTQTRPRSVFGGSFPGSGFHSSGLLMSVPPGLLTYTLQFTAPGTFPLRCLVHPDMNTTVKVSP